MCNPKIELRLRSGFLIRLNAHLPLLADTFAFLHQQRNEKRVV
jgi:hypothetical protein